MKRYLVRDRAYDDVWRAVTYVDKESGSQKSGDKLITEFDETCERLAATPLIGKPRPDIDPGMRCFPWNNHLIFYYVHSHFIEVVRVLHHRQSVDGAFDP